MKIKGTKVVKPPRDVVVFPRPDGEIAFWVTGADSYDVFDAICPLPDPPTSMMAGGEVRVRDDDPTYLQQLRQHHALRLEWLVITALNDPENEIEWELVKADQPKTWKLYEDELRSIGLLAMEIRRLESRVWEVNALNEGTLDAARKAFLAGRSPKNPS
jgi:hypothetical protein